MGGPFAENDRVYSTIEISRLAFVGLYARRNARLRSDRLVDDDDVRADISNGDRLAVTAAWHR